MRAGLLARKTILFEDFSDHLQQNQDSHEELIERLNQLNNGVLTTIDAALSMRKVNNWYFETMAIGLESLPLTIESSLRNMAENCPQRYGAAVGRAQAILVYYGKLFTPSDECKEVDKVDQKSLGVSGSKGETKMNISLQPEDVTVFPNPVSNLLTIRLHEENFETVWNIDFMNMRGQILESVTCDGLKGNIHVNKHSAGVYLVRVRSHKGVVVKRVIIK